MGGIASWASWREWAVGDGEWAEWGVGDGEWAEDLLLWDEFRLGKE